MKERNDHEAFGEMEVLSTNQFFSELAGRVS